MDNDGAGHLDCLVAARVLDIIGDHIGAWCIDIHRIVGHDICSQVTEAIVHGRGAGIIVGIADTKIDRGRAGQGDDRNDDIFHGDRLLAGCGVAATIRCCPGPCNGIGMIRAGTIHGLGRYFCRSVDDRRWITIVRSGNDWWRRDRIIAGNRFIHRTSDQDGINLIQYCNGLGLLQAVSTIILEMPCPGNDGLTDTGTWLWVICIGRIQARIAIVIFIGHIAGNGRISIIGARSIRLDRGIGWYRKGWRSSILDRDRLGMGDGIATHILGCPGTGNHVVMITIPGSDHLVIGVGDHGITIVRSQQTHAADRCNRNGIAFYCLVCRHRLIPNWWGVVRDGDQLDITGHVSTRIRNGPGPFDLVLPVVQAIACHTAGAQRMRVNDDIGEFHHISIGGHPGGGSDGISIGSVLIICGTVVIDIIRNSGQRQVILVSAFQTIVADDVRWQIEGRWRGIIYCDGLHTGGVVATGICGSPGPFDRPGMRAGTRHHIVTFRNNRGHVAIIGSRGNTLGGRAQVIAALDHDIRRTSDGRWGGVLYSDGLQTGGAVVAIIRNGPGPFDRPGIRTNTWNDIIQEGDSW